MPSQLTCSAKDLLHITPYTLQHGPGHGSVLCSSATIFNGGFTAAALVGCAIAGGLHGIMATGANLGIGVALGAAIFGASVGLGFLARQDLHQTFSQWAGIMVLAGTRNLRSTFKCAAAC